MSEILRLNSVSMEYEAGIKALSDINFSVDQGEFISIIGKSGAGKSTLLRCINRLIRPTDGEVIFDGQPTSQLDNKGLRNLRSQIGMIFQHYNLVDRTSVLQNVLNGRLGDVSSIKGTFGIFSDEDKKLAVDTLVDLGLKDHIFKRADELSGGQKQRVGIARALVQNPKMILADEPIASLDPQSSKEVMDTLGQINNDLGITVIANLHQVDVAVRYSERIIGVAAGEIVFDGPASDITQKDINRIYGTQDGDLISATGLEGGGSSE